MTWSGPGFDVFLSYARNDAPIVFSLKQKLEDMGLRAFIDTDLRPGTNWYDDLQAALSSAPAIAILVGPGDLGPTQEQEVQFALIRQVEEKRAGRTSVAFGAPHVSVSYDWRVAPIIPDPAKIHSFPTAAAFEAWLRTNHARETEVWLRVFKKGSGIPSVAIADALDLALCWGWIDGIRKSFDEPSYLQRYTPRRAKGLWSQVNREHVARLTTAGRMTPHGQRQVDAAKADGRWDAAYAPIRSATPETIPDDLRVAIEASAPAAATFRTLNRQNLFALTFRTNNMKTPSGRARKIASLVAMLERGETIVPQH